MGRNGSWRAVSRLVTTIGAAMAAVAISALPVSAHGYVYSMGVNATRNFSQPVQGNLAPCEYSVGHGNIYNLAYSKMAVWTSGPACQAAKTIVTGCSGLNCPSASKSVTSANVWFQAEVAWVSLVYSHSELTYYNQQFRRHHYCVPNLTC